MKNLTHLLLFAVSFLFLLQSCDEPLKKGDVLYSDGGLSVKLYIIATPIDSAKLAGMKLGAVEYKKHRNELKGLFPCAIEAREIEEEQFYKNKGGNQIGTIVDLIEVSHSQYRNRPETLYQIALNPDVKSKKVDLGIEGEIMKSKLYTFSKELYVRTMDTSLKPDPKYN